MPGPLREAAGFSYQEFSNLKQPLPLRGDPFGAGSANHVSVWAELLQPETAKPLAYYDHPFFGRYPAITLNRFGKGSLLYQGTVPRDQLQAKIIIQVLETAGLTGPDQKLPSTIRVSHGSSNTGRAMHFYLNFSSLEQRLPYSYSPGVDVLSNRDLTRGGEIPLAPWRVAVIEER